MLVTKKLGEIYAFKLVSGEEIIGKINKTEGGNIILDKPLRVQMQPSPDGNGLMPLLAPFVISCPVEKLVIEIKTSDVMVTIVHDKDFANQYKQAVSAVLQAATPSIIL